MKNKRYSMRELELTTGLARARIYWLIDEGHIVVSQVAHGKRTRMVFTEAHKNLLTMVGKLYQIGIPTSHGVEIVDNYWEGDIDMSGVELLAYAAKKEENN